MIYQSKTHGRVVRLVEEVYYSNSDVTMVSFATVKPPPANLREPIGTTITVSKKFFLEKYRPLYDVNDLLKELLNV